MEAENSFFLRHVAPSAGCVVAWLMFASPLKSVAQVRRQKYLGDLNPIPFCLIIANCLGWLCYSYVKPNIYLFLSNQPGLMLGVYMTVSCYGFAEPRVRNQLMGMMLFLCYLLTLLGCITVSGMPAGNEVMQAKLWGYTAVAILVTYYAAPLSVVAEVLQTKNSASLHWPFCIMNTINSILWIAYGLAIQDTFIWGPNGVGAVFSVFQVILCMIFPVIPKTDNARDSEGVPHDLEDLQPFLSKS